MYVSMEYYISIYSTHRLIFLKNKNCVLCEVQTEFLYILQIIFTHERISLIISLCSIITEDFVLPGFDYVSSCKLTSVLRRTALSSSSRS